MHSCLRRRAEIRAFIEADAKAVIEQFGENAYSARTRQHFPADVGDMIMSGPADHWEGVKEAIRRIEGRR